MVRSSFSGGSAASATGERGWHRGASGAGVRPYAGQSDFRMAEETPAMPEHSNGDAHRYRRLVPAEAWGGQAAGSAQAPADASHPVRGAVRWLGTEMRRLRLELGISQRELTHQIGLSAHSNLGEYERGSRIPPGDIILACERLFAVQPGYLQQLRRQALRERARLVTRQPPHDYPADT